ncbi:beta-hydroxyacid dehydrogenase, 3-hydroxyisobutyrate dehydrogenase [Polaromonas sp. CF318]|uniref:NAD(P)-dependent oxidoreductase n=1 Tax=Polaromonas sp. CF318 TaxID=1144318 RepID=UPI000270EA85|nr:NAD(P)-dependent oxidoreductase [Polaromonas sp. CF318]EJL85445.1 beta-hydroxyacid dehydrogenase, 3-hydroxyisobutyrate dehydrogenase [Polaromonas sp. CF318]
MAAKDSIGIVGLGLVGTALARRLMAAGFEVTGFDLREEARAALAGQGGRQAASLAEVAGAASCVVLAVFDTADVLSVVEGPEGLLSVPGVRSIIDCSTGTPHELQALAARLTARGIAFIEAPLSGSSQQIAAGEATLLLGGETQALRQCEAVLAAMAGQRFHVGGAGMGARAKLATNLVLGLNRAALAEGMVFAESLGIAPEQFLALVLASPATSGAAQAKGRMMVDGDFAPHSRIRQHLKDLALMIDSASAAGQELPLSQAHAALLRAAVAAGDGELDNAAIIRELRRRKTAPPPTDPNQTSP